MRSPFALAILSVACLLACVTPAPEPAPMPAYPQPPTPAPPPVQEPVADAGSQVDTAGLCGPEQACPAGSYCRFDEEASCGAGGGTGVCETVPQMCNRMYAPVCGCDGKTHSNSCAAAALGVNIQKAGACEAEPSPLRCGGIAGLMCPKGSTCSDDPSDTCDPSTGGRDCMGICRAGAPTCEPVRCKMFCKNGWQIGAEGCEICACKKL